MIDKTYIKQQNDCRDIAARYTELKRVNAYESHGPCPFCGGNDRFVAKPDGWFCRPGEGHCGKHGDVIALVMAKENLDFPSACQKLGGDYMTDATQVKPTAQEQPQPVDMSKYLWRMVDGHRQFMESSGRVAGQCRDYWMGRGFTMATAARYKIAFGAAVRLPGVEESHPAVAIPWYDTLGELVAIKYRFLETHTYTGADGKESDCKNTSRGSSRGHLFGWQAHNGSGRALFVTEGELNAIAIWQAGQGGADTFSVGAQGMLGKPNGDLIKLASEYRHRFVWADKRGLAEKCAKAIGAKVIVSEEIEGDAAEFLKAGELPIFLSRLIK